MGVCRHLFLALLLLRAPPDLHSAKLSVLSPPSPAILSSYRWTLYSRDTEALYVQFHVLQPRSLVIAGRRLQGRVPILQHKATAQQVRFTSEQFVGRKRRNLGIFYRDVQTDSSEELSAGNGLLRRPVCNITPATKKTKKDFELKKFPPFLPNHIVHRRSRS